MLYDPFLVVICEFICDVGKLFYNLIWFFRIDSSFLKFLFES